MIFYRTGTAISKLGQNDLEYRGNEDKFQDCKVTFPPGFYSEGSRPFQSFIALHEGIYIFRLSIKVIERTLCPLSTSEHSFR